MANKNTITPYEMTMNSLLDGRNTQISSKGARRIREFLADNYPGTKLIKLNRDGSYYLQW